MDMLLRVFAEICMSATLESPYSSLRWTRSLKILFDIYFTLCSQVDTSLYGLSLYWCYSCHTKFHIDHLWFQAYNYDEMDKKGMGDIFTLMNAAFSPQHVCLSYEETREFAT